MTADTYIIDKRFTCSVARSQRVIDVAEAFGLGLDDTEFVVFDNLQLEVPQGSVVYITGQSGSGKSLLLRDLERQMGNRGLSTVNLDNVPLDNTKPLIEQIGTSTGDAQRLMTLAGLTDAYLWIRRPSELSDGQRYRFRLAKAMETKASVWVADEFMAVLDRTAAKVIAYSVQKAARSQGKTLIVATTHTDMVADLAPSLFVEKRYREKLRVETMNEWGVVPSEDAQALYKHLLGVM